MYGVPFDIDNEALDKDFLIPIGKAKIEKEGEHVTIVSFSRQMIFALEAAEILKKDGINAEVL